MSRILLVHGWSFDASLWDAVIEALPEHECLALDFGYFGPPRGEVPDHLDLVAGHSFGCLWAMRDPRLEVIPLVAVNGFPRFSAAPDFPHGIPVRVIERMLKRLQEAPEEVLQAFRERLGALPVLPPFELGRLARDLERLRDEDARGGRQPLLALAAADDPLLPMALSEQAFPDTLRVASKGGHLLPWTQPKVVAECIREGLKV